MVGIRLYFGFKVDFTKTRWRFDSVDESLTKALAVVKGFGIVREESMTPTLVKENYLNILYSIFDNVRVCE